MKIIFKAENESIIKVIDDAELTKDALDELKMLFDNKEILRYEIIFKEGVLVKDVHNIGDLTPKNISFLNLTIKN